MFGANAETVPAPATAGEPPRVAAAKYAAALGQANCRIIGMSGIYAGLAEYYASGGDGPVETVTVDVKSCGGA